MYDSDDNDDDNGRSELELLQLIEEKEAEANADSDVEILSEYSANEMQDEEEEAMETEAGPSNKRKRSFSPLSGNKRARTDSSNSSRSSTPLAELPPSSASGWSSDEDVLGPQQPFPPLPPLNPRFLLPPDPASIDDAFDAQACDEFAHIQDILYEHWQRIRQRSEIGNRVDIHNVRVVGQPVGSPGILEALEDIFAAYQTSFDINVLNGFVLRNTETDEYRYFHYGDNTKLFKQPFFIRDRASFDRFLKEYRTKDPAENAFQHRPDTKWVFHTFTNAAIIITRRNIAYATGMVRLPNYIARNRGLANFRRNEYREPIKDRICFFRCMAYALFPRLPITVITRDAQQFMEAYCEDVLNIDPADFPGIQLADIPKLEWYLDRPITVYQLLPYVNERLKKKKKKKRKRKKKKRPENSRPRPRHRQRCGGFLDDEAVCGSDSGSDEDEEEEAVAIDNEYDEEAEQVEREEERARQLLLETKAIKKRRFSAVLLHRGIDSAAARERLGCRFTGVRKPFPNRKHLPLILNLFVSKTTDAAHFSFIKDLDAYAKCFHCKKCSRIMHYRWNMQQHENRCKGGKTEDLYPGNGFRVRMTVIEKLDKKYNIRVPERFRLHPYYAAYDWESLANMLPTKRLTPIPDLADFELPAEMDPRDPPANVIPEVQRRWKDVCTKYGVAWQYATVYRPRIADVTKILTKLAAKQRSCFQMLVKASLFRQAGARWISSVIVSSDFISNPQEFEAFLATVTRDQIRLRTHQGLFIALDIKIKAKRIEYTSRCIPASVAVATNVPHRRLQTADGKARAFFLIAKKSKRIQGFFKRNTAADDVNELVVRFVRQLYEFARLSGQIMRRRLRSVFKQIEHQWLRVNLHRMHIILLNVLDRKYDEKLEEFAFADHDDLEGDDEAKAAWYNNILDEIDQIDQAGTLLHTDMAQVQHDVTRLELPTKAYKAFAKYFTHDDRREYFECRRKCHDLQQLHKQLQEYCMTLATFGFNSGKFDINLIKRYLLPILHELQVKPIRRWPAGTKDWYVNATAGKNKRINIIKRGNNYMSISTSRVRFLDMSNFLAPGTSYDGFLKAQDVSSAKFFWPHEYFTCMRVLRDRQVPPIEAFYNSLRGEDLSEANYKLVCDTWRQQAWRNLFDMLRYYNCQDVLPFLDGIEKMRAFFMAKENCGIDFIAGGNISLPGIAEQTVYRMTDPHVNFVLPQRTKHTDNSQLHTICKLNTVGGPSTVFRRYACRDVTRIRTGDNNSLAHFLCKRIICLDVNSLYLKASMLEQATSIPRTWYRTKDGMLKSRPFYRFAQSELEWLEWESFCRGDVKIWHRFNGGIEQFGGPHKPRKKGEQREMDHVSRRDIKVEGYSVDGWDPESNTVYFFDGCLWHGHEHCTLTQDRLAKATPDERAYIMKRRFKDAAIRKCLDEKGYNVVSIWECEWKQYTRHRTEPYPENFTLADLPKILSADPIVAVYMAKRGYDVLKVMGEKHRNPHQAYTLNDFREKYFTLPRHKKKMTDAELIKAIADGSFFGIVKCNVKVPDNLRDEFGEMQPIFKNCEVSRDDIGDHMKAHCEKHNEWQHPRRMLVGSYFGDGIALITPLLQWYIQHGIKITKIYTAYEFKPMRCFEGFGQMVTKARRESDRDAALKPIGDMKKLTGNSIYGKSIMDLLQHTMIEIMDELELDADEDNPYRKGVEELHGDYYEAEFNKRKIVWNTNFVFGFFVYGYAKLHMLQFHYDFLRRYHDPRKWETILMDTDSEFLAIAGDSLDDCLRDEYVGTAEYEAARIIYLGHRDGPQAEWDKREPGKLKLEWYGEKICALNSKCYAGVSAAQGNKTASKGLPKKLNELTFEQYEKVLKTKQSHFGYLSGFKATDAELVRFDGERAGLTYIYGKRPVAADGIMTTPFLQ